MFLFVRFVTALVAAEAPVGEGKGGGGGGVIYSILIFFTLSYSLFTARQYRI